MCRASGHCTSAGNEGSAAISTGTASALSDVAYATSKRTGADADSIRRTVRAGDDRVRADDEQHGDRRQAGCERAEGKQVTTAAQYGRGEPHQHHRHPDQQRHRIKPRLGETVRRVIEAQPLNRRRGDREHERDLRAGERAEYRDVPAGAAVDEPVRREQNGNNEHDRDHQLEETPPRVLRVRQIRVIRTSASAPNRYRNCTIDEHEKQQIDHRERRGRFGDAERLSRSNGISPARVLPASASAGNSVPVRNPRR